jgi:hypothetical protein
VKFNTSRSGKAKDWEDGQSSGLNVGLGLFCVINFSRLMALDEAMSHMLRDHRSWAIDDLNKMISTTAPMIRISV